MNNNVIFIGIILLLAANGTINATQTFLLLALLSSTLLTPITNDGNGNGLFSGRTGGCGCKNTTNLC